jgi:predicted DNA-binding transcriptional regulator AlpA
MDETKTQTCQLWDAKTLGQRLSLSKRQIFRLNSAGLIPRPLKICGAVRWEESTICDWLRCGAPDRKSFEQMNGRRHG